MPKIHVAVIGAGIIGLAVAYHLARAQVRVTIVDRDPEGDKTSHGNAGAIAVTEVVPASTPGLAWRVPGWVLDPLGPVSVRATHLPRLLPWLMRFAKAGSASEVERISVALAAINSRVYEDLVPMLDEVGLTDDLHRFGALTIYETEKGYRRDLAEWELKHSRGIELQTMTGAEARLMEPSLGPRIRRAVFTPQWSHVSDPRAIVAGLTKWLLPHGVEIHTGEVRTIDSASDSSLGVKLEDGSSIPADHVVVAAGAWSGVLARHLGDRVLLESERGYNSTIPNPGISVKRTLIFAEKKFVVTPLTCGLRIGGAAEFGGLNARPDFRRSEALTHLAQRFLPNLHAEGGAHWAGHRPATPDSLPVIGPSKRQPKVWYAFGHGHLGLTQAATTGRLISDLIASKAPPIDVSPYAIDRFS